MQFAEVCRLHCLMLKYPHFAWAGSNLITVKFLNFRMPEKFAEIYLKFKQRPKLRVLYQNVANGIANSEDPDQTAPLGNSEDPDQTAPLGLHCLPRPICPKKLGSLRYKVKHD